MAFGTRRSFGAKIFVFTAVLVLTVVGFITAKNSLYLKESMGRQYQSGLIDSTQMIGERISGLLNRWDTKLGFFVQALLQSPEAERSALVQSFLKGEMGVVGMQILRQGEKLEFVVSEVAAPETALTAEAIPKAMGEREISVSLHPSAQGIGVLYRKIRVRGTDKSLAVVLHFETKVLLAAENSEVGAQTYLLDQRFVDLLSRQSYAKIVNQKAFVKKAMSVVKGDIGSGYLGELIQGKKSSFVAYHQLQPYPLLLVIHQDTSAIQKAILAFIEEMLKWTVFFVLIAVLFSSWIVRGMLKNLHELALATQKVGEGNFRTTVAVRSEDEIGRLSASFNLMTRKIVHLLSAEYEKARLEQELSTAQTIQNTFFKEQSIIKKNLHISSYYKAASECGGDWWGYFSLGEGLDLILIGDATGHGVPAALVTAIAYATANLHAEQMQLGQISYDDPASILRSLNRILNRTLEGRLCMSFLALVLDKRNNRMIFSNGGHPFPLLLPEDPADPRLGPSKKHPYRVLLQKKKAMNIVGIDAGTEFHNDVIELKAGDKLLIYTDGLTECEDANGKKWGSRGLQKILSDHGRSDPETLQTKIREDVLRFNAKGEQFNDDVTLVVVEFLKDRESLAA